MASKFPIGRCISHLPNLLTENLQGQISITQDDMMERG
jgi:hypothetical protein